MDEAVNIKSTSDLLKKAMMEITHTASAIGYKQVRFFKQFGISPQQYQILEILRNNHPDPMTFQKMKSRIPERTPHTTRMIDKLEKADLVNRERSVDDRRKIYVHISDKGLLLMDRIDKKIPDLLNQVYNLSYKEAALLFDLLKKFRE
jgi:MarR family transcriptional regulator, 2-MHQ and catechol-resistance regulon repressor